MRKSFKYSMLAAGLAAGFAFVTGVQAQQIKLMTGPQGGSWYPLGGAISNLVEADGIKMQVLPGAGIANVKAVQLGKADMGFGNSVSTVDGVAGREPYESKTDNVCNVATLYPQYFQIVANADSGINSFADTKGKSIAIQPKGNTAELITVQLLEVYGMTYKDMGRVSHVSYTDAVSLMKDNNAQLFTLGTTVPASSIMDLASARDIKLIAVPDDKFAAIHELNPGYTKLDIPAGSYPGQDEAVQAIAYATHLIARCDLDENVVYSTVKGIAENKDDLVAIAKAMSPTTLEMMAEDIGVPTHKGAAKYYKEKGIM
ncbi:MAG: TAXI family TRAP transporter solute-binding subunit [Castellaniella sp.]